MANIEFTVKTFTPKPARKDLMVQLSGTSAPSVLTKLQVKIATNGVISGSINAFKEGSAFVPKLLHDSLVDALNLLGTNSRVIAVVTTSGATAPFQVTGFSFNVSTITTTTAAASSVAGGDGSPSDSAIPV